MKRILFIASEPKASKPVQCDEEYNLILQSRRNKRFGNHYFIEKLDRARGDDIVGYLKENPHYIHYCGHGDSEGDLEIERDDGSTFSFNPGLLREYLGKNKNLECIILCSCNSSELVEEIKHQTKYAIGFIGIVNDKDMHEFAAKFYSELFAVASPLHAYLNTTDLIKAVDKQGIQPIFRSKLNYIMEARILQKDLRVAKKELKKYRTDLEFAERMIARINASKEDVVEESLGIFHKLMKTHPTPNEVIWFYSAKDSLAQEIAQEIFYDKPENQKDDLEFDLKMLFNAFEGVLISMDRKQEAVPYILEAKGEFSVEIYLEAFNKLNTKEFESGKSPDFEALMESSIKFIKETLAKEAKPTTVS